MKFRGSAIIPILLFITALPATAQMIDVTAELERDSIMIGDQITFSIRASAEPGVDFHLPQLHDTLTSRLEILFPVSSDTVTENGRRIVDRRYMITGFEAGTEPIPPLRILFEAEGITDSVMSPALSLQVYEPEVDTTQQIKPIRPPINTPLSFKELLPWIGIGTAGLLAIVLAVVLVRRYRQRRRDPEAFAMRSLEPAHIIAFRELDRLKEQKLWEKGEVKAYYTRLTEITRHYIERQYGIPAMERTTTEILHAFRKVNPDDSLLDEMLEGLLMLSDLVKFAREDPLPLDNQTNLNNAYLFVQKTYPLFYQEGSEIKEEEEGHEGN